MYFTRTVWWWSLGGSLEGLGKAILSLDGLGNGNVSISGRPQLLAHQTQVLQMRAPRADGVDCFNHSQPNPSLPSPTSGPTDRGSPLKPGANPASCNSGPRTGVFWGPTFGFQSMATPKVVEVAALVPGLVLAVAATKFPIVFKPWICSAIFSRGNKFKSYATSSRLLHLTRM